MNLCNALFIGIGLLAVPGQKPGVEPLVPVAAFAAVTWSQQDSYQMFGYSSNWHDMKVLAANYVGPGTDGMTYSDWRLPTKAEYQAGITAGTTGQWASYAGATTIKWTSQSKGSQQSWCARFVVDANGEVPSQTVQYLTSNSTYSWIGAKFVRP